MKLRIETIMSMPFAQNCFLVGKADSSDIVVVDPGLEADRIVEHILSQKLHPVAILNTHGHADHIAGNAALKQAFPNAPLMIGTNDAKMLADPVANLSRAFGDDLVSPAADQLLNDGETLELVGLSMTVREIPGHSPGHIVFVLEGLVIGGDVLFQGSIGRTDFPGGSLQQLLHGIRTHLLPLPDATQVLPGHGETTTIGAERRHNPYLRIGLRVES